MPLVSIGHSDPENSRYTEFQLFGAIDQTSITSSNHSRITGGEEYYLELFSENNYLIKMREKQSG